MAYVGNTPSRGQWRKLTDISASFDDVTTTFTTSVPPGSSAYYVTAGTASQLIISLGGVIQEPDIDYTVSTNSITFTTAPAAGLSFFGVLCGDALNIGVPSDGSVSTSKLDTNLTVDLASGSAATPSLTFDANTGIYSPGEDQVAVSTGGTGRLFIDSSGNVGIGTTSPSTRLHIYQTSSTQAGLVETDQSASVINFKSTGQSSGQPQIGCAASDMILNTAGSERARIDSSGRLLVGTSSSDSALQSSLQVVGSGFAGTQLLYRYDANSAGPALFLGKSRSSTIGTKTVVVNNDELGTIAFYGADGSVDRQGATIQALIDGTPGASDLPTRLVFSTTADGASSPTQRMRINRNGDVNFYNLTQLYPETDNTVSLGLSGFRWSAVWAANGTIQTSDERAKVDIADAVLGADFIKSLRPVSYKWIEGGKRDTGERDEENNYIYESVPGTRTHWGFIAQEVKQAVDAVGVDFGGWVLTDKDDPDSQQALRYDQFIAPLTKALQEALAEIDVLKAKVAALESA